MERSFCITSGSQDGCGSATAACHGKDEKLEMKIECATEMPTGDFRGIDMNSPQPECSSAKPVAPEPETISATHANTTAMESHLIGARDLLLKNLDSDGMNLKSGCHDTVYPLNANERDSKRSYHSQDVSCVGTIAKELGSAAEITSNNYSSSRQPFPLLDLNVKVKDFTSLTLQQPFNEAQQCQLRTQILVYGSLIEGTLPGEALMGVAFADISKVTRVESWEEYVKASKSIWEKVWQTTAMRLQRNATIAGTSWPLNQNASSISLTNSSKTVATSTNSTTIPPNNDPFAFYPPVSKKKNSREGNVKKSTSKGSKSAHVTSSTLPAGLFSPPPLPNCTPPSWNVSLSGKPVAQNFQGGGNHLDPWEARCRMFPYSQHGSFPTPSVSAPWVSPYSTPERWVAPAFATGLPISHGSAHSEAVTIPPSVNGHMGFQYPSYGPAMPIVHPLASSFPASSSGNITAVDILTGKDKAGTRRSEKHDSKTKRRKETGFNKNTLTSSAQLSADDLCSPSAKLNYATNTLSMTTTPVTQPVISTTPEANHEKEVVPPLVRSASDDRGTIIPVSSVAIPTTSVSHNLIIAQEVADAREPSLQSTASLLDQAKLSAEEAAHSAALTLERSQTIWDQIKHHNFDADQEAQVTSSATAVAAAASVAKAAAAAAKLAYEAAAQAAALVNEAIEPTSGMIVEPASMRKGAIPDVLNSGQRMEESEREKDPGGKWQFSSSSTSIISAAKAKVRKQILSAAAATKRAQNLEAAVQAAELAVEAAWQVGAVVAMGDPVPMTLKALKEAGMESYWKVGLSTLEKEFGHMHASSTRKISAKKLKKDCAEEPGGKRYSKKGMPGVAKGKETLEKVIIKAGKAATKKKLPKRKKAIGEIKVDKKTQKPKKVKEVQATEQTELSPTKVLSGDLQPFYPCKQVDLNLEPDKIVEGSAVEVVPDEEGLHGVWFSAKALTVKDNQVLVLYDELLADDGKSHLQEWIPFKATDAANQDAPRVRMAHPILKDEASRKRRRSALGNQLWMVGDHVDAWMRDGWWEGVVTSISEEDENKVTVYFPGDGDRQVIKSWNLRPSLVWKDEIWVPYNDGQTEANQQENQVVEVNATVLAVDGSLKGRNSPSTKSRSIISSSTPNKFIGEPELPSVPSDTANASKKRKFPGVRKKTKRDGSLQTLAGKLKRKAPKAAHSISHGDAKVEIKFGKGKKPAWQSMHEGKDVPEDMTSAPENETMKKNKGALNERTFSPSSLSSNMSNPQVSEPQNSIPVVKKRKYQKKASKTIGEKIGLQPENL
ncbi:hypothetical protein O6H91_02G069900 [Diphasiastrum complanatum]|nr:hypothetical protein O6H91_02G069900 [Diphasiastrum complanatum]